MENKRIIGVVSGKGGVGKTTVAANISALLSLNNIPSILLDGDFYNPSIGFHFGMWHQEAGLQTVLDKKAKFTEVISIYNTTGLRLILSSLNYFKNVKVENLRDVVSRLDYEYVIIDSPPALSETVEAIIDVCTDLFVVVTPDIPSVASAKKIVQLARNKNIKLTFLLNRVSNTRYELHPKEIEETLNSKISIIIPEDIWVPASISLRTPVVISYPHSPSANAFEKFMEHTEKLAETKGMPILKKESWLIALMKKLLRFR